MTLIGIMLNYYGNHIWDGYSGIIACQRQQHAYVLVMNTCMSVYWCRCFKTWLYQFYCVSHNDWVLVVSHHTSLWEICLACIEHIVYIMHLTSHWHVFTVSCVQHFKFDESSWTNHVINKLHIGIVNSFCTYFSYQCCWYHPCNMSSFLKVKIK